VYIPRNQEVAVKMLKPGAMSEDKFIAEAIIMQYVSYFYHIPFSQVKYYCHHCITYTYALFY